MKKTYDKDKDNSDVRPGYLILLITELGKVVWIGDLKDLFRARERMTKRSD